MMTADEMLEEIKLHLRLEDDKHDFTISEVIVQVYDFCNLKPECLPEILKSFIRRKVNGIIAYEATMGTGYQPEVQSIREGDGSITWSQTDGNTKSTIYGLSEADKKELRRHRRLKGYD